MARFRIVSWAVALALGSGCAARHPQSLAERFVHRDSTSPSKAAASPNRPTLPPPEQQEAFAAAMARLHQSTAATPPARATGALTLESQDTELAAARRLLTAAPTGEHHRLVAEVYA